MWAMFQWEDTHTKFHGDPSVNSDVIRGDRLLYTPSSRQESARAVPKLEKCV
jgi:hypothetical protein